MAADYIIIQAPALRLHAPALRLSHSSSGKRCYLSPSVRVAYALQGAPPPRLAPAVETAG